MLKLKAETAVEGGKHDWSKESNLKNIILGRTNLKAETAVEGGKHDWSDGKNGNRRI